jgi:hypothetical protein
MLVGSVALDAEVPLPDAEPPARDGAVEVRVVDDEVLGDPRPPDSRVVEEVLVVVVVVDVAVVDGDDGTDTGGWEASTTVESNARPVAPRPPKTRTWRLAAS